MNNGNKKPYHECPSFLNCSCNRCPLDPEMNTRIHYSDEPKCKANKPTRLKIAQKFNSLYPNLLPHQGLTAKEYAGKKRWDSLTDEQREKITTQGLKSLKLMKTGIELKDETNEKT